jgi:hypothetical protein
VPKAHSLRSELRHKYETKVHEALHHTQMFVSGNDLTPTFSFKRFHCCFSQVRRYYSLRLLPRVSVPFAAAACMKPLRICR